VKKDGEFVEHEKDGYELVSFVKGSGVEVFVKKGLVGWVEVEEHDEWMVILKGKEKDNEGVIRRVKIGGAYIRPDRGVAEINLGMGKLCGCDMIMGNFNARNPRWGAMSGYDTMNVYRRRLARWMDDKNFDVESHDKVIFRMISTINLTLFRKSRKPHKVQLIEKTGLEHCGQMTRITLEEPDNMSITNVAWKKVNWKKMEEDLKKLEVGQGKGDDSWEGKMKVMESLPERRRTRDKNEWWTEELEWMNRDMKVMRRKGDKDWKLVKKVFRNRMINTRYEHMKDILSKKKDKDIFKIVKWLEGQRAIPPMVMGNGTKVFQHDQIGHLIVEQLQSGEETEFERNTVDIRMTKEELKFVLDISPRNTAAGIDRMSYPLLRF